VTDAVNIFDGYLREDEAKEALRKTRRTLRLWRQQRYGPPWVKIGRDVILYPRQGLLDWLKAHEVQPIIHAVHGHRRAEEVQHAAK
jgi:hypothetical protein